MTDQKSKRAKAWYSDEKMNADVVRFNIQLLREIRQDRAIIDMLRGMPNVEIPRLVKEFVIIGFLETIKGNGYTFDSLEQALQNQSYRLDFPPLQAYYMNQSGMIPHNNVKHAETSVSSAVQSPHVNTTAQPQMDNDNSVPPAVTTIFQPQPAPQVSGEKKNTNEPAFLSRIKSAEPETTVAPERNNGGMLLGGL